MKKKKQRSEQPLATAVNSMDLKALIRDHSLFFDKLIELIPPKFYLPSDEPKPWFQGLSKAAKAAAKQQTRENIRKARRDRLDPAIAQTSTLELLKQSIENEKQRGQLESDDDSKGEDIEPMTNLGGDARSVTYEELRQRLHRRIEQLRGNRGGSEKPRLEKRDRRETQHNKRKRVSEAEEKKAKDGKAGGSEKSEVELEKDAAEAAKGIEFGKVKLGGNDVGGSKKKKRKLSKEKELKRAMRLEEAKNDPEKGDSVAKKHSWKSALSRASGVKVHDDPKLLKQSLHKEKKRHEKNVEKWQDRVENREKVKKEKQQKRAENVADKIHQKKMRKIAKREKKLMRPGFEGRKEGYITTED